MPLPLSTAARLRSLVDELQFADRNLRTDANVDWVLLRELRRAVDNLRMTAWTVCELQNARETRRDAYAMAFFLRAERLRRFRQMIDDFSDDMEHEGGTWSATSVDELQESVGLLSDRLELLSLKAQK